MIVNKPSIYIYVNNEDAKILREVTAGMEEEGVFFEIFQRQENDVKELAFHAAEDSMLGSGVGISGTDIAFTIRGMKKGKTVEKHSSPEPKTSRILGTNSARCVKKQFFK